MSADAGPITLRALRAIGARLARITVANGFNNDIAMVSVGRRSFSEEEIPGIAYWIDSESPTSATGTGPAGSSVMFKNRLDIVVECHALFVDGEDEGVALELLKADVKQALFEAFTGASGQRRNVLSDYYVGPGDTTVTDAPAYYAGASLSQRDDGQSVDSVQIRVAVDVNERSGNPYSNT